MLAVRRTFSHYKEDHLLESCLSNVYSHPEKPWHPERAGRAWGGSGMECWLTFALLRLGLGQRLFEETSTSPNGMSDAGLAVVGLQIPPGVGQEEQWAGIEATVFGQNSLAKPCTYDFFKRKCVLPNMVLVFWRWNVQSLVFMLVLLFNIVFIYNMDFNAFLLYLYIYIVHVSAVCIFKSTTCMPWQWVFWIVSWANTNVYNVWRMSLTLIWQIHVLQLWVYPD